MERPLDTWIGEVLAGTYHIVAKLGEGGMGSVYEATHTRLPRRFAIKLLHGDYLRRQEWKTRFQREAEIASRLRHRHIVEVIDYNTTSSGQPYIVMEFLEGEVLSDRVARIGALPLPQCVTIVSQMAAALEAAHRQGIVHRDLKPQNVFLCDTGEPDEIFAKVLDFGISKLLNSEAITTDQAVLGTPWYMSPEQALGRTAEVDQRTDIFALGAVAYELLTGEPAFRADSVAATLHRVAFDAPTPLRQLNPMVPFSVEQVVAAALTKDRQQRTQRARDLATALADAAGVARHGFSDRGTPAQGIRAADGSETLPPDALTATGKGLASEVIALDRPRRRPAGNAFEATISVEQQVARPARPAPIGDPNTLSGSVGELTLRDVRRRRRLWIGAAAAGVLAVVAVVLSVSLERPGPVSTSAARSSVTPPSVERQTPPAPTAPSTPPRPAAAPTQQAQPQTARVPETAAKAPEPKATRRGKQAKRRPPPDLNAALKKVAEPAPRVEPKRPPAPQPVAMPTPKPAPKPIAAPAPKAPYKPQPKLLPKPKPAPKPVVKPKPKTPTKVPSDWPNPNPEGL